jgi:predicted RNase H-like nuclease (RuvC/YqgF family)
MGRSEDIKEIDGNIVMPRLVYGALIDMKNRAINRSFEAMAEHERRLSDQIWEMTKENYMLKEELKKLKGLDS